MFSGSQDATGKDRECSLTLVINGSYPSSSLLTDGKPLLVNWIRIGVKSQLVNNLSCPNLHA